MNENRNVPSAIRKMKDNMNEVIVGKEREVDVLLTALLANGHVLLEDVPGMGKTLLAKTVAASIAGAFKRIQFTPDVLPSDVTGIHFFNPKEQSFELRMGPVYTNVLLADEINRATPRTQSSLLEAMEERQVTIDGETIQVPQPYLVIATQNPVESQGTFPLPEAQMDRFMLKMDLGYPALDEERLIMQRFREENPIEEIASVVSVEDVIAMQQEVQRVYISEDVETYMLHIVQATRHFEGVEVGVSPRGTLALMRTVQAHAYLNGRDYVIPDDVKTMTPYTLAHRLLLTLDTELHKTQIDIIHQILEEVKVPVEEVESS